MTTATVERNSQAPQAAVDEWSTEEIHKFKVLASFPMQAALDSLKVLADEVPELELKAAQAKFDLSLAEQALADRETVVQGGIEGKNAEERKANLKEALKADESYQALVQDAWRAKRVEAEAQSQAERAKRWFRVWEREIEKCSAQVRFMAGA